MILDVGTLNIEGAMALFAQHFKISVNGRPWQDLYKQGPDGYETDSLGQFLAERLIMGFFVTANIIGTKVPLLESEKDMLIKDGAAAIRAAICRKNAIKSPEDLLKLGVYIQKGFLDFGQLIGAANQRIKEDRFPMLHDIATTARTEYLDKSKAISRTSVEDLQALLSGETLKVLFKETTGDQAQILFLLMQGYRRGGGKDELYVGREKFLAALGYRTDGDLRRITERVERDMKTLSSQRFKVVVKAGGGYISSDIQLFTFNTKEAEMPGRGHFTEWQFKGFNEQAFTAEPEKKGFINMDMRPFKEITAAESASTADRLKKIVSKVMIESNYRKTFSLSNEELGIRTADIRNSTTRTAIKDKLSKYLKRAGIAAEETRNGFMFTKKEQLELFAR